MLQFFVDVRVNHKTIWSNYMHIDIEMFEELFLARLKHKFQKSRYHARYHILFQITN